MNQEAQIEELELSLEVAKAKVRKMEVLDKLWTNPDFKELILEGYFKEEPMNLAAAMGQPQFQDALQQAVFVKKLSAIGELRQYFVAAYKLGEEAHKAVFAHEEMRQEILSEDDV